MIQAVPAISIVCMAAAAAAATALPVAAFICLIKKRKGNPLNVFVGAGTFVVFALVLETVLHQVVFHFFGETLLGNIWLYALYGGLAAALFEETGRFISMKLFMKKSLTKQDALMFGVGHGGAEAIITGTIMTSFSNIIMSVMINANQVDKLLATAGEAEKDAAVAQLSALSTTPAGEFLLGGFERLIAFALQIGLSYLVYRAVRYKKPLFYVLAVAIHFAVDAVTAVLSKKISVYAVELILAVAIISLSFVIFKMYKAEKAEYTTPVITTEE
jgi:uncharacterized membrane protein YhfC